MGMPHVNVEASAGFESTSTQGKQLEYYEPVALYERIPEAGLHEGALMPQKLPYDPAILGA